MKVINDGKEITINVEYSQYAIVLEAMKDAVRLLKKEDWPESFINDIEVLIPALEYPVVDNDVYEKSKLSEGER